MRCESGSIPVAAVPSTAVAASHLISTELARVPAFTLAGATAATCNRPRKPDEEEDRWKDFKWAAAIPPPLRWHSNPVVGCAWGCTPTCIPRAMANAKLRQISPATLLCEIPPQIPETHNPQQLKMQTNQHPKRLVTCGERAVRVRVGDEWAEIRATTTSHRGDAGKQQCGEIPTGNSNSSVRNFWLACLLADLNDSSGLSAPHPSPGRSPSSSSTRSTKFPKQSSRHI